MALRILHDDDAYAGSESDQLINTLYINIILFVTMVAVFEVCRNWKPVYLKRLTKRFLRLNRVPPKPPLIPFGWIYQIYNVSEEEMLRLIGLDGYMLMRYLNLCFRMSFFLTLWGIIVLVPLYSTADNGLTQWNKYTLANLPDDPISNKLWVPVVLCYVFAMYFCQLMYYEYKHFVVKRVHYLEHGDADTPTQTYYTVMLEKIPTTLRSLPLLTKFFEKLFPGEVYSVEIALDLTELEQFTARRTTIRDKLEKAIALQHAYKHPPLIWIPKNQYQGYPGSHPTPAIDNAIANFLGYMIVNMVEHYQIELSKLNSEVKELQKQYFEQREINEQERTRLEEIRHQLERQIKTQSANMNVFLKGKPAMLKNRVKSVFRYQSSKEPSRGDGNGHNTPIDFESNKIRDPLIDNTEEDGKKAEFKPDSVSNPFSIDRFSSDFDQSNDHTLQASDSASFNPSISVLPTPFKTYPDDFQDSQKSYQIPLNPSERLSATEEVKNYPNFKSTTATLFATGEHAKDVAKIVGTAAISGVGGIAKEGFRSAEVAMKGGLRGVLEATRTVELLVFGAYYKVASTAFVTFTSRKAKSSSHQMLLSHEYCSMEVKSAPNPKVIIWENVSIPQRQIQMRRLISDFTLMVGAIFWSIVVAFVATITNLDSLSQEIPSIKAYSDTSLYHFLNNYLAIALLLILINLLPFVFDFISRNYEGLKLENQIQNSIMTRYFYYQLANVFVAVGLGSIANSIHSIIDNPSSILSILGLSLPSFSIYFMNLVIIKTFTALPLEMLRLWPLIEIVSLSCCFDRKKATRRDLRTGIFANPIMLYGWIYPNLLMVLMIMFTYCCIAPLISIMCMTFFGLAYLMYKYQLLYVYINHDQSGGFMWYAVFNRSMVAFSCGIFTLVCYLAIRQTFLSGPFYVLFPLPFLIILFMNHCNSRFKKPSLNLSLERAMVIDEHYKREFARQQEKRRSNWHHLPPTQHFKKELFRQPSLAVGTLKPQPYRRTKLPTVKSIENEVNQMVEDEKNRAMYPNDVMVVEEGGSDKNSDWKPPSGKQYTEAELEKQRNELIRSNKSYPSSSRIDLQSILSNGESNDEADDDDLSDDYELEAEMSELLSDEKPELFKNSFQESSREHSMDNEFTSSNLNRGTSIFQKIFSSSGSRGSSIHLQSNIAVSSTPEKNLPLAPPPTPLTPWSAEKVHINE